MARHHAVLGGWQVAANKLADASPSGLVHQGIEHGTLNLPVEHAATHQPGVDDPVVGLAQAYHHADHAVVTKTVFQPDLQRQCRRVGFKRHDLGVSAPAGGQVELIGLVDQLRNTRTADGVERRAVGHHHQRFQMGAEVGGRTQHCVTLRIGLVLVGTG